MRYILWDFDNTLAYRPGLWSQCLADLVNDAYPSKSTKKEHFSPYLSSGFPWHTPELAHHHIDCSDAWWGALTPVLRQALQHGADLDRANAERLARCVKTEYTNPDKWLVFNDTKLALEVLSDAGWQHVILSNHVPELPVLVESLGLAKYFIAIHTSAILGYEKPHVNAYANAINALPAEAERIVMVGDSFSADYLGALSVGLEAFLVRNSHPECQNTFPSLADLVTYLCDA